MHQADDSLLLADIKDDHASGKEEVGPAGPPDQGRPYGASARGNRCGRLARLPSDCELEHLELGPVDTKEPTYYRGEALRDLPCLLDLGAVML